MVFGSPFTLTKTLALPTLVLPTLVLPTLVLVTLVLATLSVARPVFAEQPFHLLFFHDRQGALDACG